MSPELPYDAAALIGALQKHGVRFVIIGAVAAIAQGSPLPTQDFDVTPDSAPDNLEALATALRELEARLRTPDGAVEFPVDARMLGTSAVWTLATSAGSLDLVFAPAGTRGYPDLRRDAIEVDFGTGRPALVAALADVIRSKEAAGRPKDAAQLPALRQTLEVVHDRQVRGEPT